MDADVKAKWVTALRSGNYKQGKAGLKKGDNFCCLGVLCDVIDNNAWQTGVNGLGYTGFVYNGEYNDCELPGKLRISLDISGDQTIELIQLNDSMSKSFAAIADYIEKNL